VVDFLRPVQEERQVNALFRINNVEEKLPALKELAAASDGSGPVFKRILEGIKSQIDDAKEIQIRRSVDEAKKLPQLFGDSPKTGPLKEEIKWIWAVVDKLKKGGRVQIRLN